MMQIRLSAADRERLGVVPEWLDADATRVSVREAIVLQDLGFEDPDDWRQALRGDPVVEDGQPVLLGDGTPLRKAGRLFPYALLGLVWIALRRAGSRVDVDDLDFAYEDVDIRHEEPEGKERDGAEDPDPSTPPETSGA